MSQYARRLLPGILVVVALCTARPSAEIIEQILVKVNGEILTKTDLEQRQVQAIRAKGIQPADDAAMKKAIEDVTPEIIANAIDEMLLTQQGKELGYKLSDEEFDRVVGNIRKENKLDTDEAFLAALKQEGMTLSDLRKSLEKQMLVEQVQRQEVGSKLNITEEEARQYYQANPRDFTEPATVTLREILIEVPTTTQQGRTMVSVGKDDEAAKKAEAVRARLKAGEDFAKVAGEVSASASKANGGLIGPIAATELSPDLQKTLQGMKPGDITEPLRAAKGYQILKLETSKQAGVRPFDSVRDLVADKVYQERSRTEMRKFIERVRRQAIIVWKNEELRKAYEQQVASMSTGAPGPGL